MAKGTITVTISKTIVYDLSKGDPDNDALREALVEVGATGDANPKEIKEAFESMLRDDCSMETGEITHADMKVEVSSDATIEVEKESEL